MTKLTEQEIAEGWQLNTGTKPVSDGVMVDCQYDVGTYGFCYVGKQDWSKNIKNHITKWRVNPEYKAKLEEQARAVFPELNWPEKADPLEAKLQAKVHEIVKTHGLKTGPITHQFIRTVLRTGMEMKS